MLVGGVTTACPRQDYAPAFLQITSKNLNTESVGQGKFVRHLNSTSVLPMILKSGLRGMKSSFVSTVTRLPRKCPGHCEHPSRVPPKTKEL